MSAPEIRYPSVDDRHTREARGSVVGAPVWRSPSGGNPIEPRLIRAYYDIVDGRCWRVEVLGHKVEANTDWRGYRRNSTRRLNEDTMSTAPDWVREFVEAHRPKPSGGVA